MYNFEILIFTSVLSQNVLATFQTDCGSAGGTWSSTTNSCFKRYTTATSTATGDFGWTASARDCATRAPVGYRGRLAHITTQGAWNLVKGWGEAWIGGRAVVPGCTTLTCWSWYDYYIGAPQMTACISFVHSDPILLADANQDYLRIYNNDYQDAEESRQVGRICEFVQGLPNPDTFCAGKGGYYLDISRSCFVSYSSGVIDTGEALCAADSTSNWQGRLATLYTQGIFEAVRNNYGPMGTLQHWANLRTTVSESFAHYKWYDGTTPISTYYNYPGITTRLDACCRAEMQARWVPTSNYFRDHDETATFNRLCEFVYHTRCAAGELELNGICYTYKGGSPKTWEESFQYCRDSGAVLGGYFDYCTSSVVSTWINSKGNAANHWVSLRGYNPVGYNLDLDEDSCSTISPTGSVTIQNLVNGDSTNNQHHVLLDGSHQYQAIANPSAVLCMERPCNADPCKNGGVCFLDDSGNDVCSCPPNLKPPHCDSPCTPNPCQHSGTCALDPAGTCGAHVCTCVSGWTGTSCETDVDECASNPCVNGACTHGAGTDQFACSCNAGWTGTTCDSDIDECASGPCPNGACTHGVGTDQWSCTCNAGWTGTDCNTDIDECASNPCVNGACSHGAGTDQWSCSCNAGWTGTACDTDVDECASNPCPNGVCTHGIGTDQWSCTCNAGWTGTSCDTDIDECASNPCPNGACSHGVGTDQWSCACNAGWTGTTCDTDVDECASNPCPNGVCSHGVGTDQWSCVCNAGWQAINCNTDIDECLSDPCVHGVCSHGNGTDEYHCHCDPGWNDTNCNVNIDECESNPCGNGNCTDVINGYNCSCHVGYSGVNCQTNVDECSSSPCQNGGKCKDKVNQYVCECQEGYSGDHCEIAEDECVGISDAERNARLASMAAQSLSSITLLVLIGIVIGIFIILLDISVQRVLHFGEEATLLIAHLLILLARVPTLGGVGELCIEGSEPTRLSDTGCRIVAACLHYLFMVHFSFLLMESLHSYTTWTNVVVGKPLVGRIIILSLCLGLPLIPLGITAGVWWDTYMHDHTCWVNYYETNWYMEATPVLLISLITIIICEATGQGDYDDLIGSNTDKRTSAIVSSKGGLLITLLSLTTWFTGSLAVHNNSVSLYTGTSILNIILGGVILFFHTLSNTRARTLLIKILCCCCPKKLRPKVEVPVCPTDEDISSKGATKQIKSINGKSGDNDNYSADKSFRGIEDHDKDADWMELYTWVSNGRNDGGPDKERIPKRILWESQNQQ